jgi:hypothetical protein
LQLTSGDDVVSAAFITGISNAGFLDLWIYGGANCDLGVSINCYNSSGTLLGIANTNVTTITNKDGTWKRYVVGGRYQIGTAKIKIELSGNGAGTLYVDDLVFYDGAGFARTVGSPIGYSTGGSYSGEMGFPGGIAVPTGTFTPTISFQTPGNLAVVYSVQEGYYCKIGNRVFYTIRIVTSSFTYTTASGTFRIAGMPFVAQTASGNIMELGALIMRGYTKANFTQVATQAISGANYLVVRAGGSAQTPGWLQATDIPTAGTIDIEVSGVYFTD